MGCPSLSDIVREQEPPQNSPGLSRRSNDGEQSNQDAKDGDDKPRQNLLRNPESKQGGDVRGRKPIGHAEDVREIGWNNAKDVGEDAPLLDVGEIRCSAGERQPAQRKLSGPGETVEDTQLSASFDSTTDLEAMPQRFTTRAQQLGELWDSFQKETFPTIEELLTSANEGVRKRGGVGPVSIAGVAMACAQAVGMLGVPNVTLLGSGSFNIALLVKFPDEREVIARIPMADTWIPGLISSQVASMAYARCVLGIPAPHVYAWSEDPNNPVRAPYIVMERARGVGLNTLWRTLSSDDKLCVIGQVTRYHAALSRPLSFDIGSLRFSDEVLQGSHHDLANDKAYSIGPLLCPRTGLPDVGTHSYWPQLNVKNILELWRQVYDAELRAMEVRWGAQNEQDPICDDDSRITKLLRISAETLKGARNAAAVVGDMIMRCPPLADGKPCLVHADWAFRNIVVDPGTFEVTAILDWDGAAILPFELLPQYPQDLCLCDGVLGLMRSGEIFSSLPQKYQEPATIRIGPGDLASKEDWIIPLLEVSDVITIQELRVYKNLYVRCLQGWDKRLHPSQWEHGAYPKMVHYFVTNGFLEWCRRSALLQSIKEKEQIVSEEVKERKQTASGWLKVAFGFIFRKRERS